MDASEHKRTLWLWETLPKSSSSRTEVVLNKGDAMENVHRLCMSNHKPATFDRVFSGCQPPYTVQHDLDLLGDIADLAKPGCEVKVVQVVRDGDLDQQELGTDDSFNSDEGLLGDEKTLVKNLKLAGLVGVTNPRRLDRLPDDSEGEIRRHFNLSPDSRFKVVEVLCKTPDFVSGSTQLLSFADTIIENRKKRSLEEEPNIWNLDALDDVDVDLVDQDALLEAEDLEKPDAASLRVCGTTGVRKACKDCSCGLAEEIAAGKGSSTKKTAGNSASACGSCYLGDAFRCASCPYLGMPAFKPGEKIQLSARQLNADK